MKVLFVGDVVGKPGRRALKYLLPAIIEEEKIDFTIVNVDNAAGGFGITLNIFNELKKLSIDCLTAGDHFNDKAAEYSKIVGLSKDLIRPLNVKGDYPGEGVFIGESKSGIKIVVLHLIGTVFMKNSVSPFKFAESFIPKLREVSNVIVVDLHAEATSEKQAMGFFLDGKVSAVIGTHTHVPTADERILPKGTAFISDVGMTGAYKSIIGFSLDSSIPRFIGYNNSYLKVAKEEVKLSGCIIEIDEESGRSTGIKRIVKPLEY